MKRKLLVMLLAGLMMACAISFSGCEFGVDSSDSSHTHTFSEDWTYDETSHWHTATCEHADELDDKSEHNWDNGNITKEPNCTEAGVKTYTCTVCFATKTEAVSATGHSFSTEWSGNETHHWHKAICEHVEEIGDFGEHAWDNGNITKEPDCNEAGVKTYTCTVCFATKTEAVSATGHSFSTEWSGNETHHWHKAICEHVEEIGDFGEHAWDNGNITKEPDCNEAGVKTYTCTVCFATKTEAVSATGHSFSAEWSGNETHHWHKATCEHTNEVSDFGEHYFINRKCIDCKYVTPYTIGLEYTMISNGTAYEVSGIGDVTDCEIIIPATYNGLPVTRVGDDAFRACQLQTSFIIPDSVTEIGSKAFSGCNALTNIALSNNLVTIESEAFLWCKSLATITLPESVTTIERNAFKECTGLSHITLPEKIQTVEGSLFYGCSNLSSVTFLGEVKTIGTSSFFDCVSLTDIEIPNSVTNIGSSAFSGCSKLASIIIPENVVQIGSYAFARCSALEMVYYNAIQLNDLGPNSLLFSESGTITGEGTVVIGEGVKRIPAKLFASNPYNSPGYIANLIFSPNSQLESIGADSFSRSRFTTVELPSGLKTIENNAFSRCEELKQIILPNGLTTIGDIAFYYCTNLSVLSIPESVQSIGSGAFHACSALTEIYYNAASVKLIGSQDNIFWSAGTQSGGATVIFGDTVKNIPQYLFYVSEADFYANVIAIEIGNGAIDIGTSAFSGCIGLSKIQFGDCSQLAKIGSFAFANCSALTEVTIPDSVNTIGGFAFSGCGGLQSMTLPFIGGSATAESASETTLLGYIFGTTDFDGSVARTQNYASNGAKTYYIPNSLKKVVVTGGNLYGAFSNCYMLKEIILPDTITGIGAYSFEGCSSLDSILIPASVTSIGDYAFSRCSGLSEIIIPEAVTSIGNYAFNSCSGLSSITVPQNVITIGCQAFSECKRLQIVYYNAIRAEDLNGASNYVFDQSGSSVGGLEILIGDEVERIPAYLFCFSNKYSSYINNVNIGHNVTEIGDYAFRACTKLVTITLPDKVTSIGDSAFADCSGLTEIILPNGLTTIERFAFSNSGLTQIIIPVSMTTVGEYAFYGTALETVYYASTADDWGTIEFGMQNDALTNTDCVYFFSKDEPVRNPDGTYNGKYWKYASDGRTPVIWNTETV